MDKFQLFRQVVKDYNIPINFTTVAEFNHAWSHLDPYFKLNEKAYKLEKVLQGRDLSKVKEEFNKTKQEILDYIKNHEAYRKLNQANNVGEHFSELKELYTLKNHGKSFVGIDMVKANFSVLRKALPEIFGSGTYEEFIHPYCSHDYFKESKYIRQYLFGNLNPKLQQNLQKKVINLVINKLQEKYPKIEFVHKTADELVFTYESVNLEIEGVLNLLQSEILKDYTFRVEHFMLQGLKPHSFFVKKHFNSDKLEFKNIPSSHLMEAIRHYLGEEPQEMDRRFNTDGRVASFCSPLKFDDVG